ncbi:MAG TPA: SDR family oxidoreductase [Acidimicrobiia bacterium]|nr:SDR family oxidoreductase [Acidimicrobiia bacterium]
MSSAVVTGAAGGIGTAICRRLAEEGWRLILVDLAPALAEVANELETLTLVRPVQADLTTEDGIQAVRSEVLELGGSLELVVNNAGITRDARLANLSGENFTLVLDVNLGAPFRLVETLHPVMDAGAIVNISSRAYLGNFGQYNYSMSKGGLVGLTRAYALQLAPRIRVNAIAPGLIGTEMTKAIPADVREKMVAAIPMQRMGTPEEVAALVSYLATASYITGEVITIGGGRSLSR